VKIIVATASILAFALSLTSAAVGGNLCVNFGGAAVVASGLSIPGKGNCKAFNGFIPSEGFLLAGDICKSSDGTTVLFNTFTQVTGGADTLAGSWATSTGQGTGNECPPGSACSPFPVSVTKCPKSVVLPAAATRPVEGTESSTLSVTGARAQ
jgi:hypothetical protein